MQQLFVAAALGLPKDKPVAFTLTNVSYVRALEDLTLTWSPIPGGDAFDEVDVSEGGIDTDCVGLRQNKFEVKDGVYYYTWKTNKTC